MATVVYGDFEWDEVKAAANRKKHGVSFEESIEAVADERALFVIDQRPKGEERFRVIGMSLRYRVLLVVIVERGARERIISARPATKAEEKDYEQSG